MTKKKHPQTLLIRLAQDGEDSFYEIFEDVIDLDNRDKVGVYRLIEVKTVKKTTTTKLV